MRLLKVPPTGCRTSKNGPRAQSSGQTAHRRHRRPPDDLRLLWSGRTRLRFGSYAATVLSVIGTLGGVISLGWIGLALFALSNVVAIVAWSYVLSLRVAERGRPIAEIEQIAPEIGMLQLLHHADLLWLAERFDRLLPLTGEPAAKAEEVAGQVDQVLATGIERLHSEVHCEN